MEPQSFVERHLAECEAALAALDRQRDDLLAEISALRGLLATRRVNGSTDFQRPPVETASPIKRDEPRHGSKRDRIETALERLLEENGTMHRRHLFERLKDQGLLGDERNPLANLSNVLSVSGKFRSLRGGIWELAHRPSDTRTAG